MSSTSLKCIQNHKQIGVMILKNMIWKIEIILSLLFERKGVSLCSFSKPPIPHRKKSGKHSQEKSRVFILRIYVEFSINN